MVTYSRKKKFRIISKLRYFSFLLPLGFIFTTNIAYAEEVLKIGAIPDQNPEQLNRLYNILSSEITEELNVKVIYKPVTNYPAAVTAFRTGDLDLVWFGGLTGVQARLQTKGSIVIAQRDIDAKFHSLFIANTKANIPKIRDLKELSILKGKRFTFGSESSTSGRLMPQYFLNKAGVSLRDFKGRRPGFSGSHDSTLALVQSGSYEAGALNEQVWNKNRVKGRIDSKKVKVIWKTPPYFDYHWLAQSNLDTRFGDGFTSRLTNTFLSFNKKDPNQKIILEAFGAEQFIRSENKNYNDIEKIGRLIGKIK